MYCTRSHLCAALPHRRATGRTHSAWQLTIRPNLSCLSWTLLGLLCFILHVLQQVRWLMRPGCSKSYSYEQLLCSFSSFSDLCDSFQLGHPQQLLYLNDLFLTRPLRSRECSSRNIQGFCVLPIRFLIIFQEQNFVSFNWMKRLL